MNYLQFYLILYPKPIHRPYQVEDLHLSLVDIFLFQEVSKEERAGALGVYAMGIPFGIMAAYFATASLMGSGGDVDWRRIFIFLGLTGIALAGIVRLTLKEPSRKDPRRLKILFEMQMMHKKQKIQMQYQST